GRRHRPRGEAPFLKVRRHTATKRRWRTAAVTCTGELHETVAVLRRITIIAAASEVGLRLKLAEHLDDGHTVGPDDAAWVFDRQRQVVVVDRQVACALEDAGGNHDEVAVDNVATV